ncbi:hypothetical protein NBT05_11270 [Aquimarina sp. ERC-38]|uniref:hypothetical protein n=1 Tax=Aquimarina sp. ERC-38 TaxID=2949996 RepID=UPI0022480F53|nr:hypothetical protein [Aquimarina sp. ERC-38]UZO79539.1 hypothetical protein NBT05_11270 [Aquimarina sp. ERC-38]
MIRFFKNSLFLFVLSLVVTACDDGDIIVTSFEFDELDLNVCPGIEENSFVFFKINPQLDEAISYNFISDQYDASSETETPLTFMLSEGNNELTYRQFDRDITNDYYCNTVPDSDINVINEVKSTEGLAQITVTIVEQDDEDGVPALDDDPMVDPIEIEDLNANNDLTDDDTDNDGIPNYLDTDDDNDGILTSAELSNGIATDDSYRDTDEDGIPDYRDNDDDGDGVPTIREDLNRNGNPRDDDTDGDGIFNYRDNDDDGDGILTRDEVLNENDDPEQYDPDGDGIPEYLDTNSMEDIIPGAIEPITQNNVYKVTYRTEVSLFNLIFSENQDSFDEDFLNLGFREVERDSITSVDK